MSDVINVDTNLIDSQIPDSPTGNLRVLNVAQPMVKPESLGIDRNFVNTDANKIKVALESGTMLVKSINTNEVKSVTVRPGAILKNISLSNFEIRDARVVPKHDFSQADSSFKNIFAHRGPNEPNNGSAFGRR